MNGIITEVKILSFLYIQTSSEEKEDDRTVQECYSDWKEAAEMASRHFESINEMIGGDGNGNS